MQVLSYIKRWRQWFRIEIQMPGFRAYLSLLITCQIPVLAKLCEAINSFHIHTRGIVTVGSCLEHCSRASVCVSVWTLLGSPGIGPAQSRHKYQQILLFSLFLAAYGIGKFLGQGLNPRCICNLCHTSGNGRSLTHGTPARGSNQQHRRDKVDHQPAVPQPKLPITFINNSLLFNLITFKFY